MRWAACAYHAAVMINQEDWSLKQRRQQMCLQVGILTEEAAYLAVHEGRLFASTWPDQSYTQASLPGGRRGAAGRRRRRRQGRRLLHRQFIDCHPLITASLLLLKPLFPPA